MITAQDITIAHLKKYGIQCTKSLRELQEPHYTFVDIKTKLHAHTPYIWTRGPIIEYVHPNSHPILYNLQDPGSLDKLVADINSSISEDNCKTRTHRTKAFHSWPYLQ